MDHYQTLGISRTATADEIKRAYRRMASQHHPDKGGDTGRFQQIQEAYDVLSDAQRRQEYDNPAFARMPHPAQGGFDFDSIFNIFGARFQDASMRQTVPARIQLWISLHDMATGGLRTIAVSSPSGQQNIEINIPPGIEDGASVRYPQVAPGGMDLVVTFRIRPEPGWTRHGTDVIRDITVSIWDLVIGTTVELTILTSNTIALTIPPHTQPNTMLRVRGHGLPNRHQGHGDLLVRVGAQIPKSVSPQLIDLIKQERGL